MIPLIGGLARGGMMLGRGGLGMIRGGAGLGRTALRGGAGLATAGFGIQAWSELFKQWMPSVTVTYTVKAQGSITTPPRQVLHLALATVFGMSISRRLNKSSMEISVNHRTNMVEVSYTITTIAAELALGSYFDDLAKLGKALNPFNKQPIAERAKAIQDGAGLKGLGEYIGENISNVYRAVRDRNAGGAIDEAIDKGVTNPQLQKIQQAVVNRGITKDGVTTAATAVRAAWLRERDAAPNPANRNDGPVGKQAVVQADKLSVENGPRLAFELAKDDLFTGDTPWSTQVVPPAEPFETIRKTNTRKNDRPVVTTRQNFSNPQFSAAAGVDIRTLVAQVLHDPNVWPPEPETDNGPATIVEYK